MQKPESMLRFERLSAYGMVALAACGTVLGAADPDRPTASHGDAAQASRSIGSSQARRELLNVADLRRQWDRVDPSGVATIHLRFNVFGIDDAMVYATNPDAIAAEVTRLNAHLHGFKLRFTYEFVFVSDPRFYDFCGPRAQRPCFCDGDTNGPCRSEEQTLKSEYAREPARKLNLYIVAGGREGSGRAAADWTALAHAAAKRATTIDQSGMVLGGNLIADPDTSFLHPILHYLDLLPAADQALTRRYLDHGLQIGCCVCSKAQ